jgi:A/G-specific adenine glycosylase
MLVLVHENKVLLEKRPQNGIWGGLWCLPQFNAFETKCRNWGVTPSKANQMAPFQHVFTHFKLQITPWWITMNKLPLAEPSGQLCWQSLNELAETGLPAPVQKILQGVNKSLVTNQSR